MRFSVHRMPQFFSLPDLCQWDLPLQRAMFSPMSRPNLLPPIVKQYLPPLHPPMPLMPISNPLPVLYNGIRGPFHPLLHPPMQ